MEKEDRRIVPRKSVEEPELGMLVESCSGDLSNPENKSFSNFFVGVHNLSAHGFFVESATPLNVNTLYYLWLFEFAGKEWCSYQIRIVWSKSFSNMKRFFAGLQVVSSEDGREKNALEHSDSLRALLDDIDFLLSTELLEYIPTHAVWPLLNCFKQTCRKSGVRIINQGDRGDSMYIIQEGLSQVKVNKNGESHLVARLGKGNVIGEMAVLTDEPRCADVVAESKMKLWKLSKRQFLPIVQEFPDLRVFLTELITHRLETSKIVSDRNIGKYQVKHKLDQGGWGIVYLGRHRDLDLPVAIKMLKHKMAMEHDFQYQFRKEAKIIAQLQHRNIVYVHDIEECFQTIFIIMEYLEGESLENLLDRVGTLPVAQTVDILRQICNGLDYAHSKGITHHDIKPANIFIQPDGQVKILDFGLAFSEGGHGSGLRGTIDYVAPEQINDSRLDHRVDIYTVGLTAYEMITGQKPLHDRDPQVLTRLRLNNNVPDPVKMVPDVPAKLSNFIVKACKSNPDERYLTMQDALADIQPLYKELLLGSMEANEKRRLSTIHLIYRDDQQVGVNQLFEEINTRARELEIDFKLTSLKDI